MKPFQYKMNTGSIYVGFPGHTGDGMFPLYGACALSYLASKSCYDVRGLMTSTYPVDISVYSVQARQELVDDTDSALAYCNYLGTLLATMEAQNRDFIPSQFKTYIDHMNPYFMEQSGGIDIYLSGKYEYSSLEGDEAKVKEYRQQMVRAQREYKDKTLTEEDRSCQPNVVHLQFGSKSNASEKGED